MSAALDASLAMRVKAAWYVACESSALRKAPRAVTLLGQKVVLFRDGRGTACALADRCPHRNVPLSMGRVTAQGQLECGYHGWCFDGTGACRAVPGLLDQNPELPARAATRFACQERQGFVWVWATPGESPAEEPPTFPHVGEPGWTTVRRSSRLKASLHAAVENTLDVPHTAFLHGGLFRTAKKSNDLEVVVRRTERVAEAEYLGEPAPRGLIGRILAPGGGTVQHFDRFILPSLAQVEYRLGESGVFSTSAFTPVSAYETDLFAVVTFKLPLPGWLVRPFVQPVAVRILQQDARMLSAQVDTVQAFGGERYTSTELDVLGHEIALLVEQAATGKRAPAAKEHRVRMRT
ncbi:MAG: aromatic ring-hydroxylating dioxygenase subunit alpha [Myxococcaceae bacterium]|nr:aromatic ring-hydroxylating dioxygenase subunit alpha [Myxococcaceae bacterium]